MSIISGLHLIDDFNGVNCSIVEKDIIIERVNFLKDLLEQNGFEVKFKKIENPNIAPAASDSNVSLQTNEIKYILGVTDITFNPAIAVYERKLKTNDNKIVTPFYWKHQKHHTESWYWKITDNKSM